MLLVFDPSGAPVYAVAPDVNAMADTWGGGSQFLGVFYESNHGNLGSDDLWADLDTFRNKALALVEERVGHPPEPLALADFGHASSEALEDSPEIEGGEVIQTWAVGEYQAILIEQPHALDDDVAYAHVMLAFTPDGDIVYALAVEVAQVTAWSGAVQYRFVMFDDEGHHVLDEDDAWADLSTFRDKALAQVKAYFGHRAQAPN